MITQPWPTYSDASGAFVRGLPIKTLNQAVDGSAVATFDGPYPTQYLSALFMAKFRPVITGYIFQSQYGELLYMSKTAFEAQYTATSTPISWSSVTGKPTTFAPVIGTSSTTAMAGNKVPTSTDRGGVLQQAAITALTDSSGGTSGGNTVAAVPAATAASTDTSAASLTSTNAAITAVKNDLATLTAKYNALLAAVKASGVTA
ncbi:hypothetical protein RN333_08585 [Enterobacter kobei]|uniref:hypothetical protein n=1 Tax=Enterobacter kobei TaxID=208224 RepID=UPI0028CFE4E5|nr:hypothetical protein [Enterobacter kobei]WNP36237.1 hypothetical protein RN333_08585 [Enterobacter kobei]